MSNVTPIPKKDIDSLINEQLAIEANNLDKDGTDKYDIIGRIKAIVMDRFDVEAYAETLLDITIESKRKAYCKAHGITLAIKNHADPQINMFPNEVLTSIVEIDNAMLKVSDMTNTHLKFKDDKMVDNSVVQQDSFVRYMKWSKSAHKLLGDDVEITIGEATNAEFEDEETG